MIAVCSRAAGESCLEFSPFEKYNNIQKLLNYFQKIVFECVLFYFIGSIRVTEDTFNDVSGELSECLVRGQRDSLWFTSLCVCFHLVFLYVVCLKLYF